MTPYEERDNIRDPRPRAPLVPRGAKAVAVVLAIAVAAGLAWWFWPPHEKPLLPATSSQMIPAPSKPAGPEHPVAPAGEALPPLDGSDAAIRQALARALPPTALERLVLEGFVRNVVATVDNLPREHYAQRLNPVMPAPGAVRTARSGGQLVLAPDNAQRYAPLVAALEAVDPVALGDFYKRHYPLFQQAYVELGYPNGYFNDRLVAVIDHLLETPEVKGPIRLVQPKVLYEYADRDLEERSAGQKALVRLGAENVARVKAKLRQLREQVVR